MVKKNAETADGIKKHPGEKKAGVFPYPHIQRILCSDFYIGFF